MTVTRCAVETTDGRVGVSYLAGRDPRRAELAAVFDALLQDPARRSALMASVVEPLAARQAEARRAARAKAAATKVDFFTMVRGD
jgi:alpha-D-ribose 1-methylphosphonate 5-triphosphate synthase subunit PhnG